MLLAGVLIKKFGLFRIERSYWRLDHSPLHVYSTSAHNTALLHHIDTAIEEAVNNKAGERWTAMEPKNKTYWQKDTWLMNSATSAYSVMSDDFFTFRNCWVIITHVLLLEKIIICEQFFFQDKTLALLSTQVMVWQCTCSYRLYRLTLLGSMANSPLISLSPTHAHIHTWL